MEQVRKSKQQPKEETVEEEIPTPPEKADLTITDDILDEIDRVLEENAEDFVAQYVQKGGQ